MKDIFITSQETQHSDFPWCHVETLCDEKISASEQLFAARAQFPPGEQHNFHRHPHREEIIYILEGEAEQWVGEECRKLSAGEMALIPAGVPHATRNCGDQSLLILAILSPLDSPGEFTEDVFDEEPWRTLLPPIAYE
jgi:quercetin dioxygenase-like cupin family protein